MPKRTEDLTRSLYRLRETGRLPDGDLTPGQAAQAMMGLPERAPARDVFRLAVWGLWAVLVAAQVGVVGFWLVG